MATEHLHLQGFDNLVVDDSPNNTAVNPPPHDNDLDRVLGETSVDPKCTRSFVERFIESFLHPNNIKWMLLIGAAIVLASSLMLVTKEWAHWPAAFKYAAILGYTAAIYFFSEIAERRLGLKSTSNVLRCLTIVLMPIMMLGLHWVSLQDSWLWLPNYVEFVGLLLPSLGLLWFAGQNISRHFLRGDQPTFLACYGLLSIAGCFPAASNSASAIAWIVGSWLVMSVGALKVNRYVFWLTEEHKLPRIFGFSPILLLGSQFLMLVGTKSILVCPPEWIGTCLVLFSATILLTTRSVANVFRERTGDLVRPLPWSIGLPLVTGVLVTFAGVILSCWGFTFTGSTTTYAVVPTAILASTLMAFVAFDTRHSAFTWLSILFLVIAYQASPVFIKDMIMTLKASAASALHEERLPIAFYGLTYLPLLVLLTMASRWTNHLRRTDISVPLQQFVTCAAAVLWFSSLFHIKAAFLVSTLYVIAMIGFGIAFRDRRYAFASLIVAFVAVVVYVPFSAQMLGTSVSYVSYFLNLSLFGLALYSSRTVDRCLAWIPLPADRCSLWIRNKVGADLPFGYCLGLVLLVGLALCWVTGAILTLGGPMHANGATVTLLLLFAVSLITFRSQNYLCGLLFAVTVVATITRYMVGHGMPLPLVLEYLGVASTVVSIIAMGIVRWTASDGDHWGNCRKAFGVDLNTGAPAPDMRLANTREKVSSWLRCHIIALGDLATLVIVVMSTTLLAPHTFLSAIQVSGVDRVDWQASFVIGWLVACCVILNSRLASIALAIFAPLFVAGAINTYLPSSLAPDQLPIVFALVSAGLCLIAHFSGKTHLREACFVSRIWLGAIALVSFVYLSLPIRIAGAISLAALLGAKGRFPIPGEKVFIAILCNVHLLLFVAGLSGAHGWILDRETVRHISPMAELLFPSLTLSILFATRYLTKLDPTAGKVWAVVLIAMSIPCFGIVLADGILRWELQILVLAGIAVAFTAASLEAIRTQKSPFAWTSLAMMGLALIWLWDQRLLSVGTGLSQIVILLSGVTSLWASKRTSGSEIYRVYANPLSALGIVAPATIATLAVLRHFGIAFGAEAINTSAAYNFIALLAAAAVYFFHGMHTGKRRFGILALGVLNIAMLMICHAHSLTDLQFYCVPVGLSILAVVELLKRELPSTTHDPLRYIGALIILVSPVFGMRDASWTHLLSLMLLSVLVILIAIGLRIRVLMYTGTAFLLADLAGMVIRSTNDNPVLLWVGGISLGISLIVLAAVCENHRENLLSKIRVLSAELATWN